MERNPPLLPVVKKAPSSSWGYGWLLLVLGALGLLYATGEKSGRTGPSSRTEQPPASAPANGQTPASAPGKTPLRAATLREWMSASASDKRATVADVLQDMGRPSTDAEILALVRFVDAAAPSWPDNKVDHTVAVGITTADRMK